MAEPYEIYLSPKVAEVLDTLVTQGQAQRVMTMTYIVASGDGDGNKYILGIGKQSYRVIDVYEDALFALAALGLIIHNVQEQQLFVTQAAIDWINYHRKWRITRFFHRLLRTRQNAIVLLGVASTLLGLALTILEILQRLNRL